MLSSLLKFNIDCMISLMHKKSSETYVSLLLVLLRN